MKFLISTRISRRDSQLKQWMAGLHSITTYYLDSYLAYTERLTAPGKYNVNVLFTIVYFNIKKV